MTATMLDGLDKVGNIKGIETRRQKQKIKKKLEDLEFKEVEILENLYNEHFRPAGSKIVVTDKSLPTVDDIFQTSRHQQFTDRQSLETMQPQPTFDDPIRAFSSDSKRIIDQYTQNSLTNTLFNAAEK